MIHLAFRRLLATAFLALPVLLLGAIPSTAATSAEDTPAAASCTPDRGVGVVVEPEGLGGETLTTCDPRGAGVSAQKVFAAAGVDLEFYRQTPGFVCTVEDLPQGEACTKPGDDGYWGLFWTDGKKSEWTFSMKSVEALTVPAGGKVAWVWQAGQTPTPPQIATDATLQVRSADADDSADPDATGSRESNKSTESTQSSDSSDRATSFFVVGALIAVLIAAGLVAYALRKREYDN